MLEDDLASQLFEGDSKAVRRLYRFIVGIVSLLVAESKQAFSGAISLMKDHCTLYLATSGEVPRTAIQQAMKIYPLLSSLGPSSPLQQSLSVKELLRLPGVPERVFTFFIEQTQYSLLKLQSRINKRYRVFMKLMDTSNLTPTYREQISHETFLSFQELQTHLQDVHVSCCAGVKNKGSDLDDSLGRRITVSIHKIHETWGDHCRHALKHPRDQTNVVNQVDKVYKAMQSAELSDLGEGEGHHNQSSTVS